MPPPHLFHLETRIQYPLSKLAWSSNYNVKCIPGFRCEWSWKLYVLKVGHLSGCHVASSGCVSPTIPSHLGSRSPDSLHWDEIIGSEVPSGHFGPPFLHFCEPGKSVSAPTSTCWHLPVPCLAFEWSLRDRNCGPCPDGHLLGLSGWGAVSL